MDYNIDIQNVSYATFFDEITAIKATLDGTEMFVPLDPTNRHYAEILRQVEAGELTIADAD